MMRWKLFVILLFCPLGSQAVAHGTHGHGNGGEIRDHVAARQGEQVLSLRMAPDRGLAEADAEHHQQSDEVYQARVGELSFLIAERTAGGDPVSDVVYSLVLEQIEGDKQIFSTTASAPDGTMSWGQQFFDGSKHRVSITATSKDGSFAPMTAQMVVGVQAVQPPSHIVARTLLLLLGLTAVAMTVGYGGMHYLRGRRAPATAPQDAVEPHG